VYPQLRIPARDYLPADSVLDGELVATGPDGKPNVNLLHNFKSAESHITYYAFDVLIHKGRDLADVVKLMIQHVLSTGVKCCLPASAHNLESVAVELDLLCGAESYVAYR
jgi:hypothetical protein